MTYEGVPEHVTLDFVREWVRPRVSEKRFRHIAGVVAVGRRIAKKTDCDTFLVELCGWLHDACKEMKDRELVAMARQYGLKLDAILENFGHLLHGPVAAETVVRELKITHPGVYDAIAEHTLGAVPMSELSKVVFLADCLEDSRPPDYTKPIWQALDLKGSINLDAAMVAASEEGLKHLIRDGKPIHPKTIDVRNYYLDRARSS